MAVTSEENVKSYSCDETTTDFSFPFSIIGTDTDVLKIIIWEDATSAKTELSEDSGTYSYTVSAPNNNFKDGGTISTTKLDGTEYVPYAWSSDYTITIERIVPFKQSSEFTAGGLDPVALENTFDNIEYQIQQLDKRKSIHGPPSDPTTSVYELPTVSARKGRVLGFDDATGDIIAVSSLPASEASVTAFMESVLDDANAATAQATLKLKDYTASLGLSDIITKSPRADVRAYGAVGNGVADDTVALQAAIDDATAYGIVVLPPGTYKFSQLKFYNPIVFTGLGSVAARWNNEIAGVTLLHDESTNPAIIIGGTSDSVITSGGFNFAEGITLANFFLYPAGSTANVGILLDGSTTISGTRGTCRNIRIENVTVRTFGSNNIKFLGNVFDVRFKGGGSRASLADGVVAESAASEGSNTPNQLHFYDFYSQAQTGDWNFNGKGIHLYGGGCAYGNGFLAGANSSVYSTHFEALLADPASVGIQIVGQYGIFMPGVISNYDTAIIIGDGTATVARRYFINTTINAATVGVEITAGGSRQGSGVIYFSDDVTTDIQDDRAGTDSVYNSLQILNDTRRIETIRILDNTGTPTVGNAMVSGGIFLTGGTTTITDFDDGYAGQLITVLCKHSLTFDFTTGQDADHNLDGSSANITADTGDILKFMTDNGTTWSLVSYLDASVDNN